MGTCAAPGKLSRAERDVLPPRWFGLPNERRFPLARMVEGRVIASPSHARNALARASQSLMRGTITQRQYLRIERRARRVLEGCEMAAKKKKKKTTKKKAAKKKSAKKKPASAKRRTTRAAAPKPRKKKRATRNKSIDTFIEEQAFLKCCGG